MVGAIAIIPALVTWILSKISKVMPSWQNNSNVRDLMPISTKVLDGLVDVKTLNEKIPEGNFQFNIHRKYCFRARWIHVSKLHAELDLIILILLHQVHSGTYELLLLLLLRMLQSVLKKSKSAPKYHFILSYSVRSRRSGMINNSTKFIGCEKDKVSTPNRYCKLVLAREVFPRHWYDGDFPISELELSKRWQELGRGI